MFELNGTFVIFIALFLLFMYLLNEIMLKPVGNAIAARKMRVKESYKLAKDFAQEGEALVSHYKQHIDETRVKAQTVIHSAVQSAKTEQKQAIQQIQQEGSKKLGAVKAQLHIERKALLENLVDAELDIVQQIVHKLLGDSSSPAASRVLNRDEVLRTLEEAK